MNSQVFDARLKASFRQEQRNGLVLALKGRLVVIAILAVWIAFSRPEPLVWYTLAGVGGFALLGALQLILIRRRHAPIWIPYVFSAIDVIAITVAVAVFSGPVIADLPSPIAFRFHSFLYFFLLVAASAFAYSPGLVLFTGVFGALCWGIASLWILGTEPTLTFSDIADRPTAEQFFEVFLHPTFFGQATRIAEVLILSAVAGLLAVVMVRARRVVYRQALAEREHRRLAQSFGRYVPDAVARAIVEDGQVLAAEQREATVLFIDVADFTTLAETMQPSAVADMLNAYFDAAAKVIGRHGGVITQFQGDAILATYNLPLADPEHAAAATRTAIDLVALVDSTVFAGVTLRSRIGINTGMMFAGNVGSAGRLNYTVHGDAVNLAARLETLNKTYETRMLVGERSVELAGPDFPWRRVTAMTVRGRREPATIYTLDLETMRSDADNSDRLEPAGSKDASSGMDATLAASASFERGHQQRPHPTK